MCFDNVGTYLSLSSFICGVTRKNTMPYNEIKVLNLAFLLMKTQLLYHFFLLIILPLTLLHYTNVKYSFGDG